MKNGRVHTHAYRSPTLDTPLRNLHVVTDETYLAASSSQSKRQAARNPSRFSSRQGKGPLLATTPFSPVPAPPPPLPSLAGRISLSSSPPRWNFRAPGVWGDAFACIVFTCSRLRPHARSTIVCTVLFTWRLAVFGRAKKRSQLCIYCQQPCEGGGRGREGRGSLLLAHGTPALS